MNVVEDDSVKVADDDTTAEKDTEQITLDMYQDGMDIAQIAQKRGMVEGTVYGHLIHYVGSEIEAEELIDLNKLDRSLEVLKANEGQSSSQIKIILGEDYSYPEIKIGQKVLETKV